MTTAPTGRADATAAARRLRTWATDAALPLWASVGRDARLGGFHERLDLGGLPDADAIRRVRVQARQIYVYAHASVLGWSADGVRIALDALDALIARYRSPDGAPGFVHTLQPDGSIHNPLRDTYDHAFILLALAWLARASGDAQVRALVDEVIAFIDEYLAAPDGTYLEGLPHAGPRRQNPHMHLFEAMLALHETIAHPDALARAGRLHRLLAQRFVDPASGTLTEFFTDDWRPWQSGAPVEPGHHAEWCWLLYRYALLSGAPLDPMASAFFAAAKRSAAPESGLLADEAPIFGSLVSPTFRCWPQTEFAKASLAQHALGAPEAADEAARALSRIEAVYLAGPVRGGWFDQFDASGRNLAPYIPASTFYHLFSAIAEADRLLLRS